MGENWVNFATLLKATIHNNAKRLLPKYDVSMENSGISISRKETEYNKPEVVDTSEWVEPYTKLDAKTNRYRKVKGYWRNKQTSVTPDRSDITGTSDKFVTMSDNEKVRYLLGGKV